ncbi:MAG: aconitase family protein [Evtepia gabavorous]
MGPTTWRYRPLRRRLKTALVKNAVLEFAGPGIAGLPMDYRIGIDVMTTETACLSSIWETDGAVEEYLAIHGRPEAYEALHPQPRAPTMTA